MSKDSKTKQLVIGGGAGLVIVAVVLWMFLGLGQNAPAKNSSVRTAPVAPVAVDEADAESAVVPEEVDQESARLVGAEDVPAVEEAPGIGDDKRPAGRKTTKRRKPAQPAQPAEPEPESSPESKKKWYGK